MPSHTHQLPRDLRNLRNLRNLYGTALQPCGEPHHTRGSWHPDTRECSELDGGVHQICAVMNDKTTSFSRDTGQSDWSAERHGQNHCLCLGAYALFSAQGQELDLKCESIPAVALSPAYVANWSTWNGQELPRQIEDGVRNLVAQCQAQTTDARSQQHLHDLACTLQSAGHDLQLECNDTDDAADAAKTATEALQPGHLREHYAHIFQQRHRHATNNRNAAGHLWATHILEQSTQFTVSELQQLFSEYCPVSGSPVQPGRAPFAYLRKGDQLVAADAGETAVAHCCRPCVCDLQDGARVVDHAVSTRDGEVTLPFLVLRHNPCRGQQDGVLTAHQPAAPAMHCTSGHLTGATLATLPDGSKLPIIGLVQEEEEHSGAVASAPQAQTAPDYCADRRQQGYRGGMGQIFRRAAGLADAAP